SVETISESKKMSAEKYKKLEYKLKKWEVEARIKIENEKLDLEKQMKIDFELKLKELETRLKELEMKHH
ncbi:5340_t:CDS:2, partial [Cetraspora pellucida]